MIDRVVIDFTGYVDEEAFEGGSAEDFPLELGSGQFIRGFRSKACWANRLGKQTSMLSFPRTTAMRT